LCGRCVARHHHEGPGRGPHRFGRVTVLSLPPTSTGRCYYGSIRIKRSEAPHDRSSRGHDPVAAARDSARPEPGDVRVAVHSGSGGLLWTLGSRQSAAGKPGSLLSGTAGTILGNPRDEPARRRAAGSSRRCGVRRCRRRRHGWPRRGRGRQPHRDHRLLPSLVRHARLGLEGGRPERGENPRPGQDPIPKPRLAPPLRISC